MKAKTNKKHSSLNFRLLRCVLLTEKRLYEYKTIISMRVNDSASVGYVSVHETT